MTAKCSLASCLMALKAKILSLLNKLDIGIWGAEINDQKFFKSIFLKEDKNFPLREYLLKRNKSAFRVDFKGTLKSAPDIIAQADEICGHHFKFLGVDKKLGGKINWCCDFNSNYTWGPLVCYKDIRIPSGQADIKIPWELSRFQHFAVLGQAYRLTQDEKYSKEFVSQISDWLDQNAFQRGVNWACTMDVAIRACNWVVGYDYFRDSPELTDEFLLNFLRSFCQHGEHIMANLEYSPYLTSNHYLSDIAGLIYLGILFSEFKQAQKWRELGIVELIKEIQKQVYPDGCDFEASTCYHRLVLELFFYPTLIAVVNDPDFHGDNYKEIAQRIFSEEYTAKLYKMFEAVRCLLKPNGEMPQVGDNDNGQLHKFACRKPLDMRYLLTLGAVFFHEPKFKIKEFGFCEEAVWLFGERARRIWDSLEEHNLANIKSKSFTNSGWYVMRDQGNYLLISCGPNGQNDGGGHCHNDKLSFEWHLNGEDVIVDPGTYMYTSEPKWRNQFRSTSFHNTVVIDNCEQNRFSASPVGLFKMNADAQAKILKWETSEDADVFVGRLKGYGGIKPAIVQERKIVWNKRTAPHILKITDTFKGKGKHSLEWNFHFLSALQGRLEIGGRQMSWNIEDAWLSPGYGEKVKALKATAELTVELPFETEISIKLT